MSEAAPRRRSLGQRLRDAGGGRLRASRQLNGEVSLADGRTSSASLCLSDRGLYLVFSRTGTDEVVDLLAADRELRYRSGLLGDRLEIDDWSFGVPWRQGGEIRRLIGQARLRRRFGAGIGSGSGCEPAGEVSEGPWAWTRPFIDKLDALEREWLRCWLDPDERLLAFKRSDETHGFSATLAGADEQAKILVITDRRQQFVALSTVGDLWSLPLATEALGVESSTVGRSHLVGEDLRVRVKLGDEALFRAFGRWLGLTGNARLRAVAQSLWRLGERGVDDTRAAEILDALGDDDPLARLARVLIVDPLGSPDAAAALNLGDLDPEAEPDLDADPDGHGDIVVVGPREPASPIIEALEALIEGADEGTAEALLRWWDNWDLGPELGEILVGHLCELGPAGRAIALPLHQRLREIWLERIEDDPEDAALIDFVLAEHLLALGRAQDALALLGERREKLPSEQLQDLLPPAPGRGGQRNRIELYELVATAHEQLGDGHVAALAELARLQPLVGERIDALVAQLDARASEGGLDDGLDGLHQRATQVRALLIDERALAAAASETGADDVETGAAEPGTALATTEAGTAALDEVRVRALDGEQLEILRHPAARVDGVLGRLQGTLAKVVVPDCSMLKSYCERANLARTPALARAMADATMILGLGGVEVFVSRGDKSVGLRAYEGSTSFLLIGGDHLDPRSDAYLDEGPLRFAIAAELAHLRYAHSRVTGNEVWAGTVDLGLTGLGMLIVAAPILKGLKAPAKHLLDKVGAPAIERWRKKLARRDPHSLANDNSQVIAAHRVMQLSADRAGLLACGDPRAAIRAMFAVHPGYLALWPLVASHGLRAAVTKSTQSEDERSRLEDLAVRVAALLSFYLSDEYAELRHAVLP